MKTFSRSQLRRLVIQECYKTSLIDQLYEQATPAPADPAAADPSAIPADPTAVTPPTDPAAPAVPAAAGAPAPTAAAPAPVAAPVAAPTATPPAAPAAAPVANAGDTAKKKAAKPDQIKEPTASKVRQIGDEAQRQAAEKKNEKVAVESLRKKSLRFLLEQSDDPKIDIGLFADKLANLIKNYTSLVDVKKSVITQGMEYIEENFPKEAEALKKQLEDLLRTEHHISLERPEPPPDSYAVGAKSGGGAPA